MSEKHLAQLEKGGLSSAEAQIYLALVRSGNSMSASAIVAATGVSRGSIYPTLTRLTDMGLVEAEAGYGGQFSAIPPERALPSLIAREQEELSQRERILNQLAKELPSVAEPATVGGDAELIQVLRDPRVIAERFERLEREAERSIEVFIKAPFFAQPDNPAQTKAMRRGVRVRGIYEQAVLDSVEIKPNLPSWISKGEEARVYPGELPHKLAIFDRQSILMPLITAGGQGRTLFIRHPQLAASLGRLFDYIWNEAEPLALGPAKKTRARRTPKPAKIARRSAVGASDGKSENGAINPR